MKCPYCLHTVFPEQNCISLGSDAKGGLCAFVQLCPRCRRKTVHLVETPVRYNWAHIVDPTHSSIKEAQWSQIYPLGSGRPPCPPEVPQDIAEDYQEACLVHPFSPKASAALSRRCLQHVLRDAMKTTKKDLADQIQEVLDAGKLPTALAESIDMIRNVGNYAAHPMKSKATGEILPVESHAAEWNLEVLEALFDYCYVQPVAIQKRRAALNAKLATAGKPPVK